MTDYSIKEFNPLTGQVTLGFFNYPDIVVDVPIEQNAYISGDALHQYLKGFIPTWDIERRAQVAAAPAIPEDLLALRPKEEHVELPYDVLRRAAYPDFLEFIDGMVKADAAQMQSYVDKCLAVKALYPKPVEEQVSAEVLKARREL